MDDYQKHV